MTVTPDPRDRPEWHDCPDHPRGIVGPLCHLSSLGQVCRHRSCVAMWPCPTLRQAPEDIRALARVILAVRRKLAAEGAI